MSTIPVLPPPLPWANVEVPSGEPQEPSSRAHDNESDDGDEEYETVDLGAVGLELGSRIEVNNEGKLGAMRDVKGPCSADKPNALMSLTIPTGLSQVLWELVPLDAPEGAELKKRVRTHSHSLRTRKSFKTFD